MGSGIPRSNARSHKARCDLLWERAFDRDDARSTLNDGSETILTTERLSQLGVSRDKA